MAQRMQSPPSKSTTTSDPYTSYLPSAAPASLVLLSLALLVSSGFIVRSLDPHSRFLSLIQGTPANKQKRKRENVLKTIIAAQGVQQSENSSQGEYCARSRSASSVSGEEPRGGGRSSSVSRNSVASTSSALVTGLARVLNGGSATGARAEGSGNRSGAVTPVINRTNYEAGSGSTQVNGKGKGKKGKGVAATSFGSNSALALPSPSISAVSTRSPSPSGWTGSSRKFMRDVSTTVEDLLALSEAAVQTSPTAPPSPQFAETDRNCPPILPPLPPSYTDAVVQTSPLLLPARIVPYDLHASFQSTPPPPSMPFRSTPPPSPSPSPHHSLPTSNGKSRKQIRKASANALKSPAANQSVVGMRPSPAKSKDAVVDSRGNGSPPRGRSLALSENGLSPLQTGAAERWKGKEREIIGAELTENGGSGNGTGLPGSRYENTPLGSLAQRRMSLASSSTVASSYSSRSAPTSASSSSSPYLNHPGLAPPLSPMSKQTLNSAVLDDGDETYWISSQRARAGDNIGLPWEGIEPVMGLGVDMSPVFLAGDTRGREGSPRNCSESESRSREVSIDGMVRVAQASTFDPPLRPPAVMMSPLLSPRGTTNIEPAWVSQPPGPSYGVLSLSPIAPSRLPSSSVASSQSRPSSRQSSLSVPTSAHHQQQIQQQQQHQLQQQQQHHAFVYAQAQAQAQYTHAILQYQSQQHQHQSQPPSNNPLLSASGNGNGNGNRIGNGNGNGIGNGLESSVSNGKGTSASHVHGSGKPYNNNSVSRPSINPQSTNGWKSLPPSPLLPNGASSVQPSPTGSTFPSGLHPYYNSPSTSSYLNHGPPSPSHLPTPNRKNSNSGGRNPKSPKLRSISLSNASGTNSNGNASGSSSNVEVVLKAKLRTAEMEADRSGKELEIARWRLAVLEEDRRASEIESLEALSAVIARAQRAEARIKILEEARQQDGSSASPSGSGSPVTRPASVADTSNTFTDPSPLLPASESPDPQQLASPSGIKIHPLAWLDLDTVSLGSNHGTSNSYPRQGDFRAPHESNGRRRSPRPNPDGTSGYPNRRASGATRNRARGANKLANEADRGEDTEDEEVTIVMDSPTRRRTPKMLSRQHSYLGDDDGLGPLDGEGVEDDELSNVDFDEMDSDREHVDYVGSLPSFLSSPSTIVASSSPPKSPLLSPRPSPSTLIPVPSFTLDCATPSPSEQPHREIAPEDGVSVLNTRQSVENLSNNSTSPQFSPKATLSPIPTISTDFSRICMDEQTSSPLSVGTSLFS